MAIPKYDDLFNPTLQALHNLGGSASTSEMEEEVARILSLSEDQINEIHKGSVTKLAYRLAWSRNYLKRYGILENSSRGIWALTSKGIKVKSVDKREVNRYVKGLSKQEDDYSVLKSDISGEQPDSEITWKEELLETIKSVPSDAFERLCKRLLRESGFTHVEVTGKSGDGGIDGKGVVKVGGLLSFHVVFQSKRYKETVGASVVRDFRGAMVGRADKGLIITTGLFTRDAKTEAQRDGAPPIDLIDGEELAEKLKELRIGVDVKEKIVEEIFIKRDWFQSL